MMLKLTCLLVCGLMMGSCAAPAPPPPTAGKEQYSGLFQESASSSDQASEEPASIRSQKIAEAEDLINAAERMWPDGDESHELRVRLSRLKQEEAANPGP